MSQFFCPAVSIKHNSHACTGALVPPFFFLLYEALANFWAMASPIFSHRPLFLAGAFQGTTFYLHNFTSVFLLHVINVH